MKYSHLVQRVVRRVLRRGPMPAASSPRVDPVEPIIVACVTQDHFRLVEPFLTKGGFRPVLIVRDVEGAAAAESWPETLALSGAPQSAVPVVPLGELPRIAAQPQFARVPVLVACAGGDGEAFRSLAPRIAPLLGPEQQMLHPSFLADFVNPDLSGNVMTYGHVGSGNVIFMTIMQRLLAIRNYGRFDQLNSWCASGHIILCEAIFQAFRDLGMFDPGIGYSQPGFLTANAALDGDRMRRLFIPHVPSQVYVGSYCYGTHAPPVAAAVGRYMRAGGKLALLVRHPLDNIVSVAAKSATGAALSRQGPADGEFEELREQAWREKLGDDDAMNRIIHDLSVFLKHAARYSGLAETFRYEDLLAAPKAQVRRIAAFLEVSASDAEIEELSELVGTTELGPPGHRFRPGAGKWVGRLNAGTIEDVRRLGILDIAVLFGYDIPPPEPDTVPRQIARPADGVWSYMNAFLMDDDRVRRTVRNSCGTRWVADLETSASRPEDVGVWERHVDGNPYLSQVLHAMKLKLLRY